MFFFFKPAEPRRGKDTSHLALDGFEGGFKFFQLVFWCCKGEFHMVSRWFGRPKICRFPSIVVPYRACTF